MRARAQFWCKCRDAYERAWDAAITKAAHDAWERTHKLTALYFYAVESDFITDADDWHWRNDK